MRTHPHYDVLFQKLKGGLEVDGSLDELQILEMAAKLIERLRKQARSSEDHAVVTARETLPNAYIHDTYQAVEGLASEVRRLAEAVKAYQKFILDHVESLRQEAMDISLKYEPCGYYCDEEHDHIDHKLFNDAKYLYGAGDGKTFAIPDELLPESLRLKYPKLGERF